MSQQQIYQEGEAAIAFALIDLAQVVKSFGVDVVISKMDEETFWQFYKWFGDNYGFDFVKQR